MTGRLPKRRDAGITLVEMAVSMLILTVVLSLTATATLSLTRSVRRERGTVDAQQSTRDAFFQLDKQIRYANAVSVPATIAGTQWIEWQVPDPTILVATSITQSRCYQWRAVSGSGLLQFRSWLVPTTGLATASSWRTVASGLVIGSQPVFTTSTTTLTAPPFNLPAVSDGSLAYARVGVSITTQLGSPAGRSGFSSVFTGLNSSAASASVCAQVARS